MLLFYSSLSFFGEAGVTPGLNDLDCRWRDFRCRGKEEKSERDVNNRSEGENHEIMRQTDVKDGDKEREILQGLSKGQTDMWGGDTREMHRSEEEEGNRFDISLGGRPSSLHPPRPTVWSAGVA